MKLRHLVAGAALGLATLTGCGGSEESRESPKELLADAKTALGDARAFRIEGDVLSEGEVTKVDIGYVGDDAQGALEFDGVGSLEFLVIDDETILKGSKELWDVFGGSEVSSKLAGKWTTTGRLAQVSDSFGREKFVSDFLTPTGKVSLGPDKKIDGVECVSLVDVDGTTKSYLYLDEKNHRPVRLETDGHTADLMYESVPEPKRPATVLDADKVA